MNPKPKVVRCGGAFVACYHLSKGGRKSKKTLRWKKSVEGWSVQCPTCGTLYKYRA